MWPPMATAAARYVGGSAGFAIMLGRSEGWQAVRLPRQGMQWVRGIAISVSAMGMFMAVWIMPLADATTIFFVQPIITAVLATIFLREPARRSTWVATLAAFIGVVIVLRPNFQEVGWGVLFPLMGACGMAVTIIANRAVLGAAIIIGAGLYLWHDSRTRQPVSRQ